MSSSVLDDSVVDKGQTSLHDLHRSIVTVFVGPDKYPFYFHKDRLCEQSPYFQNQFNGSFKEATTGTSELKNDGIDEIKLFEEWLYSGSFQCPEVIEDASFLLIKLFCFAERVQISKLRNDSLDALRNTAVRQASAKGSVKDSDLAKYTSPAPFIAIKYAYENTPEHSPLRRLLADIFAYNVKPEALREPLSTLPIDFIGDVLLINMMRLPLRLEDEEADFDENAKRYHITDSPATEQIRKSRVFEARAPTPAPEEPGIPDPVPEPEETHDWGLFGKGKKDTKKKGKKMGNAPPFTAFDFGDP